MDPAKVFNSYAVRLMVLTALAIFVAEVLLMLLLESWGRDLPLLLRVFLDASLLMLCVFPTLYLLVFKEMEEQIQRRYESEKRLEDLNCNLELLVAERTLREQRANHDLLGEIQERARVELALGRSVKEVRAGREHLYAVMNAVHDGVLVVDSERRVRLVNTAAERLLSTNAYDLLGQPLATALTTVIDPAQIDALLAAGAADAALEFSWTKNGRQAETLRLCSGSLVAWDGGEASTLFLRRASLG